MSILSVWNLYDSIQCEMLKRWMFIICLNIGDCLFFDFFFFFHQYFLAMALRLHHPMLDADVEYTFLFRDFYFCMLLPLGRCFLFLWIFTDTTIPERKSHENAWFNFKMKKVLVTFWNITFFGLTFRCGAYFAQSFIAASTCYIFSVFSTPHTTQQQKIPQ